MGDASKLDCFDHVVVLMMENRSFDNILGYLSDKVDGVVGKNLSNPAPISWNGKPVDGADEGPVFVSPTQKMDYPNPDPGEYFPHVNTQLYNVVAPTSNAYKDHTHSKHSDKNFQPPYNQPADGTPNTVLCNELPYPAPMNGFVQDYYDNYIATKGIFERRPTREEYSIIMNCFPTEKVPVMSGLATNFAVFDKWHCAVPSQTFCNRSFFNAATSNGQVVNAPYGKWLDYDAKTIFTSLEEKDIPWVIYYDKTDFFPLTLLIHFKQLWPFFKHNRKLHFRHMEEFYDDVANGNLPAYSFVEPRLFFNHNDQHPPIKILGFTQRSTVSAGECLINEVYEAIRDSGCKESCESNSHKDCSNKEPGKSNSENTLLTITYDEHGGCFDHVSPPKCATSPDNLIGEMGFSFDRLGVRVSTIMVSAYIEPGQIMNSQMQHTSMLKTLGMKWGFGPLTNRDKSAPDFLDVFTRDKPRPGCEWPTFTPYIACKPEPETEVENNLSHPLNDLQKAILHAACAVGEKDSAELPEDITVGAALDFMKDVLDSFYRE